MIVIFILGLVSIASCGPSTDSYKDQFCTDPRTMRKHAAYTEWADAYSCTRHRCQPGGRNLAIYTVGCKRVEAPESAIECEEVVEDTNMQFPFCCTRLRCLVVVRGEVWTRVLGQPWEALPAAPWSHMYKMKRPPPADNSFLPKTPEAGPVYELTEPESQKVLRAKTSTESPDCNDAVKRSIPAPDIVIALSTNPDKEEQKGAQKKKNVRHKRYHKKSSNDRKVPHFEEEHESGLEPAYEMAEARGFSDTPPELRADVSSAEAAFSHHEGAQEGPLKAQPHQIPQSQWNEHDAAGTEPDIKDASPQQTEPHLPDKESPTNLQALVDAIGTRMRDIETVVQRMSDKVHDDGPQELASAEKQVQSDAEAHKTQPSELQEHQTKKPNDDDEQYKRFSVRNRGSKYLHVTAESSTEPPLFIEDRNMNGYFSDASNNLHRRSNGPKEPAQTYMAPIETRRKHDDNSDEQRKHKKHTHKKKKKHSHKKHKKEEKRKRFNRLSSAEIEKNVVSLEDSAAV